MGRNQERSSTNLFAGFALSIPKNKNCKLGRHDLVYLVELGKELVTLIKGELKVPSEVNTAVCLREGSESCLNRDAKVMACTADGPE